MAAVTTGPCDCSRRSRAILGASRGPNGLPSNNRVCAICMRHLGDTRAAVAKRDQDHRELWLEDAREAAEVVAEQHAAEVSELQQRIEQLQKTLDDRPTRVVVENLDLQTVRDAEASRHAAFRSRDDAFRALSELRLHHNPDGEGQCRCGRRADRCDVAEIVDHYPALRRWEEKQVEYLARGLPHMLPDGHPSLLDRRFGTLPDALCLPVDHDVA